MLGLNIKIFKVWLSSKNKKQGWKIIGVMMAVSLSFAAFEYLKTRQQNSSQEIAIQTVETKVEDLTAEILANGIVQPVRKINLSPEDAGRIVKLYVNEGDRVVKGQVIARLSSSRIQAQIDQYQALLLKAESELQQKQRGNRPEEIAQGKARLAQSEANLKRIRDSFPQEIDEALAQIASSQARVDLANARLSRYRKLYQEGAIALDRLDEVETEYKTAQAEQKVAQKRLDQLKNNRSQQIAEQAAQITQEKESFNLLQKGYRVEEIAQAEAEVAQTRAQLKFYQTQLNETVLRAPFEGIVTRRFAQEGDFITPTTAASSGEGATSISVAELSSGLAIEGKIQEANISKVYVGQQVKIQADAYPDKTFKGQIYLIAPRAIQENNITFFQVKIALKTGQNELKAGMNVKLFLIGKPIKNALTIPLSVIVTQPNGQTGVYLVDAQNKLRFVEIQVSAISGDRIQVTTGLKQGDRISLTPPKEQKIEGVDSINLGS
jgi:HlyD family secretion protein